EKYNPTTSVLISRRYIAYFFSKGGLVVLITTATMSGKKTILFEVVSILLLFSPLGVGAPLREEKFNNPEFGPRPLVALLVLPLVRTELSLDRDGVPLIKVGRNHFGPCPPGLTINEF